ncbi:hypothetical protein HYPDE_38258 [Hyphomicrobium denitrificans 1NES1]|uniref:Uncharacterized protein n=1 Tax=Hyphomicrobium denitrificans 1NES1 TaxID=670307 RepID=N0B8F7_9HYPH|nr:hypothetical protein HYPDE_38258 [Hyphomicrobium denitrificans 1NES1]
MEVSGATIIRARNQLAARTRRPLMSKKPTLIIIHVKRTGGANRGGTVGAGRAQAPGCKREEPSMSLGGTSELNQYTDLLCRCCEPDAAIWNRVSTSDA